MISLANFIIPIPEEATAQKQYTYQINEDFFAFFENSFLKQGSVQVDVIMEKTPMHIRLLFTIRGTVELLCDRTLMIFDYPIDIERAVHFKKGNENKELDVDMYMIEKDTTTLSLAQHIYDFVSLAVPMKRLHPSVANDEAISFFS